MLSLSLVVNYKLLDQENTGVSLHQQLFSIYNNLYGGNIDEEISDSIGLISQADIMTIVGKYNSNEFYEKRNEVQWAIYLQIKQSLKDYYITCHSAIIVNMEFDSTYQSSIAKIMAETQRIQEVTNLLEGEKIIAQTNKDIATLNAAIALSDAQTAGGIYASIRGATATAQATFNAEVVNSINAVSAFGATTAAQQLQFFYLLAMKMSQNNKKLYLYQPASTVAAISP